jgi:general bacterial porin, GBP family
VKKYLLSALLACCAGAAHAQSSVTLYGLIDEGLSFNSNQGGSRNYFAASSVMQGSRWGMLGMEDLGGGLKATFRLESGFDLNSGVMSQGSRLFGRQAYVGLISNYGTLTLGRQYDPVVDYVQPLSLVAFMGAYGGHPLDNDNLQDTYRVNNAVKLRTATYGGASAEAMYAFSNTADGFSQNSAWSLGAGWQGGSVSLGAGLIKLEHPASNTNGAVGASGGGTTSDYASLANTFVPGAVQREWIAAAAGTYTLGSAMLGLVYSHVLYVMPTSDVRFDNFEFDAQYYFTPFLRLSGAYTLTRGDVDLTGEEPRYHQFNLVLDYFLSKRTDIYLMGVYQRAAGDASEARIYPVAASNSVNQYLARVAIRHKF